jgi:hypothetical protein
MDCIIIIIPLFLIGVALLVRAEDKSRDQWMERSSREWAARHKYNQKMFKCRVEVYKRGYFDPSIPLHAHLRQEVLTALAEWAEEDDAIL